ncbi:MAG TPA: hypothetical protein DCS97_13845 [Planctomycetes bacterium]|nr:hypothetical protein [Planctomycetota bacterium]
MTLELAGIILGSLILVVVLGFGLWKLLKGMLIIGLTLILMLAVYVGSFFATSSVDRDGRIATRTFTYPQLLQAYAPLRVIDVLRYGKDGFVWR